MLLLEQKQIKISSTVGILLAIFVFIFAGYELYLYRVEAVRIEKEIAIEKKNRLKEDARALIAIQEKEFREKIFSSLDLKAKSAFVFDVHLGTALYELNAEKSYPLASLTKVMTALIASRLPRDTEVAITINNTLPNGTSTAELSLPKERWHLGDLLSYTLLSSYNEGAEALAFAGGSLLPGVLSEEHRDENAFVYKMNEEARRLSLKSLKFYNASGLDITNSQSGGYGSARDIAMLFKHILSTQPELFTATALSRGVFYTKNGLRHKADNTNILSPRLPGLMASKTGYTNLAGGNLALAVNAGPARPIIVVVLGSTKEGRFEDAEKLIRASIEAIRK